MDDSKSIRAAEGETLALVGDEKIIGQQASSDKIKRKYSRGKLFEIAQSIEECRLIREDLDKFKSPDWTQYHLDVIDCDERGEDQQRHQQQQQHLASLSSIRIGELASGRLAANSNHQQQQRKIFRMTSSPAIRSNWGLSDESQPSRELDDLSSQVRAKYARLIKTMAKNSNNNNNNSNTATGQFGGRAGQQHSSSQLQTGRQSLVRTTSHNSRHLADGAASHQHQSGSTKYQQRAERRNSEEPMSLPYSINTNGRTHSRDSSLASRRPHTKPPLIDKCKSVDDQCSIETGSGHEEEHEDQDEDAPIMRIGAPTMLCYSEPLDSDGNKSPRAKGTDVDEDDFDITSLLSITVLSDIKTIRQDLASFGRQSSNLSRPSLGRTKSHELTSRMPARSRTSLELHYNNGNGNSNNMSDINFEPRHRHNNFDPQQTPPQQYQRRHQHFYPGQARPIATGGRLQFQSRRDSRFNYPHDTSNELHGRESESLPFDWRSSSSGGGGQRESYSAGVGLFASSEVASRSQYLANIGAPNTLGPGREPFGGVSASTSASKSSAESDSKQKPMDESSAKIIKLFKEQVKARAEAPIVQKDQAEEGEEEKLKKGKENGGGGAGAEGEKSQPVVAASKSRSSGGVDNGTKATNRGSAEINSVELNEIRSSDGQASASGSSVRLEARVGGGGKRNECAPSERQDEPKTTGTNPAESEIESESGTATVATLPKTTPTTTKTVLVTKATSLHQPTSTGKLDNEQRLAGSCANEQQRQKEQQQRAEGKISGTARVSNIPRLISLYRAKSDQDAVTIASASSSSGGKVSITNQVEKRSLQPNESPTTDGGVGDVSLAKGVGSGRANIKQSCKFVSQYKTLRGKSLADEVEESSSSSAAS